MLCKETSNKNFRKQSVVRIENYSKWHFQKFQKLIDYPQNTKKPKTIIRIEKY